MTMPDNMTVRSGSQAQLRCVADGSPEPVITWFKDGRSVVPQGRVSLSSEGEHSRGYIVNLQLSATCHYICKGLLCHSLDFLYDLFVASLYICLQVVKQHPKEQF